MNGGDKNKLKKNVLRSIVVLSILGCYSCKHLDRQKWQRHSIDTMSFRYPTAGFAYRFIGSSYNSSIDSTYSDTETVTRLNFYEFAISEKTLIFDKLINEFQRAIQTSELFKISSSRDYYIEKRTQKKYSMFHARFSGEDSLYVKFIWIWYSDTDVKFSLFRGKLLDSVNISSDIYTFPRM